VFYSKMKIININTQVNKKMEILHFKLNDKVYPCCEIWNAMRFDMIIVSIINVKDETLDGMITSDVSRNQDE